MMKETDEKHELMYRSNVVCFATLLGAGRLENIISGLMILFHLP